MLVNSKSDSYVTKPVWAVTVLRNHHKVMNEIRQTAEASKQENKLISSKHIWINIHIHVSYYLLTEPRCMVKCLTDMEHFECKWLRLTNLITNSYKVLQTCFICSFMYWSEMTHQCVIVALEANVMPSKLSALLSGLLYLQYFQFCLYKSRWNFNRSSDSNQWGSIEKWRS